ncbi:I78 family peptidase inhibitor [Arenimonas fontis]|uniref:Peptidase inhibitor I78 family protein n=1 Tax=Arenimonas fontis TaxID=2608255 RepID=A0A5B2Z8B6_9GAMM|nr:I78 family peptidase inhibitor [Arenimonas fontis]KAA2284115.1 hypothetical protein F0415_10905 [Arenimonas fontis]
MRLRPLALALALAMTGLCACANGGGADRAGLGPFANEAQPPPAMDAPGLSEETAMTCDAEPLAWTIGRVADEALVAKAKADSGSRGVRVIRPGMAVTMDYREDRLNLEVDEQDRVTRAYCG